ncbi:MAG: Gfo/Idh/MocA family oxidoreductase [Caulobacteraceae bacterium]
MTTPLRAGVIGAGVFGAYHAAKYATLPGVILAGVHDIDQARAADLAARTASQHFSDLAALLAEVDVVSIASPAGAHARAALSALSAGVHVYVEKPLATSLADADAIGGRAAASDLVVACGFLERAAVEAIGLFGIGVPPLRIEAVRAAPPSPRNLDVSVVMDLMIHDLDLALALTGSQAVTVEGEAGRLNDGRVDEAIAEATFESGAVASFRASRVALEPERWMRLTYPTGDVRIDFLGGGLVDTTGFALDRAFAGTPAGADRLAAGLAAFIAAVRGERPAPLADARDGARALDLALAVEQAILGG